MSALNTQAPSAAQKTLSRGLAAAMACEAAGITDPLNEIPALCAVTKAAASYRRAVRELRAAEGAHRQFAANHANDDPAHEAHQQRTQQARVALADQETELAAALRAHEVATGESMGNVQ